jgi:uncharacterized protein YecE (DUF72 family)
LGQPLLGCSGWNYGDTYDRGGWVGVFYQDCRNGFNFYERFYSHMTKGTFIGMVKATPEKFQFSVKVPEINTHQKRLDVNKSVITDFEEFLDKISP